MSLREEQPRRFGDAVDRERSALAEPDVVQIELEDLILASAAARATTAMNHSEQLALRAPLRREERVLDQLLRERAAAAQVRLAAEDVVQDARWRCRSDRRRGDRRSGGLRSRAPPGSCAAGSAASGTSRRFSRADVTSAVMSGGSSVSRSGRVFVRRRARCGRSRSVPSSSPTAPPKTIRTVCPLRSPSRGIDARWRRGRP